MKIKKLIKKHLSDEQFNAMNASKSELKLLKTKLKEILECLDFDRIYKTMIVLDWGWIKPNSETIEIPNIEQLKVAVVKLVIKTFHRYKTSNEFPISVGTGGFEVELTPSGKYFNISVKFVVEDWETYDD